MSKDDLELLKFYHEVGVDCTLIEGDEEDNSVSQSGESVISVAGYLDPEKKDEEDDSISVIRVADTGIQETDKKPKNFFPSDWIIEARKFAGKCNTIDELRSAVESFEGCEIKKTATNTVFSDGNQNAKIMLVGEAPGANEDLKGIPFCGASGMLLDKMLNAINLDRAKVYISNTVFWRPPGNRKPTNLELDMCRPFVEKHIALVSPQILVLVGGIACYSLLDNTKTISSLRGKFHTYTNQYLPHPITTAAIFHPAYLLRQPMQKRLAWEDLKKIKEYLDGSSA